MTKTTMLGILTIAGAVISAAVSFVKTGNVDVPQMAGAIMAGVGLIKAADQDHGH